MTLTMHSIPPKFSYFFLTVYEVSTNPILPLISGFAGCNSGDRILGRNWDKSLKSFPPCYSQSPLLTDFNLSTLEQKWFEMVCNVNIVYENLQSDNSQDYAQKPKQNCTQVIENVLFNNQRLKFKIERENAAPPPEKH